MVTRIPFLAVVVLWLAGLAVLSAQAPGQTAGLLHPSLIRHHPAIGYATEPLDNPITRLNDQLVRREVTLQPNGPSGYLESVLEALQVPVESQVLVFSKTSFQASRINPQNPRSIFFNDTVSVGWVRTGPVLEFVVNDPRQGAVFYTMEQNTPSPTFERNDTCVMCHASDATHNVPGMFVGSVFPGVDGTTMYGPAYTTDHRSPFELRWGGWFVTGTHQASRHMGNAVASNPADLAAMVTPATVHVTNLDGRFDPTGYLSPHSDVTALLVLEHQAQMLNLLTRVGWEARVGAETAGRPLSVAVAELVDYLLFVDEAPLPGPVTGTSGFASVFSASGPRDRQGRSLRDLDLRARLLRYPCSFLIYSGPFNGLPADAKSAVYARMWEVLSGQDTDKRYGSLTAEDRAAVIEILRDTKTDLPDTWAAPPPATAAP